MLPTSDADAGLVTKCSTSTPSSRTAIWVYRAPSCGGSAPRVARHGHAPLTAAAGGEEFGLPQNRRPAPAGVAAVSAPLPLGLQPRRSGDALNLVVGLVRRPRSALVHNSVGRVVGRAGGVRFVARAGLSTPAAAGP